MVDLMNAGIIEQIEDIKPKPRPVENS